MMAILREVALLEGDCVASAVVVLVVAGSGLLKLSRQKKRGDVNQKSIMLAAELRNRCTQKKEKNGLK